MDQGKVVLTGAVEELTASDTVTLIGLSNGSDVSAARPNPASPWSACGT